MYKKFLAKFCADWCNDVTLQWQKAKNLTQSKYNKLNIRISLGFRFWILDQFLSELRSISGKFAIC